MNQTTDDLEAQLRARCDRGLYPYLVCRGDAPDACLTCRAADRIAQAEAALVALRTQVQETLQVVEWGGGSFTPRCVWCGGWKRHPHMDEDYNGQPGHRPTCLRQAALALAGAPPAKEP